MHAQICSFCIKALASNVDDILSTVDEISRAKLLSFASDVFGPSTCDHNSSTSLKSFVRNDLLKFNSYLTTWTVSSPAIPHVSNMSLKQSRRSLVHRKLSHDDVSAAIRMIASDDTVLDVASGVHLIISITQRLMLMITACENDAKKCSGTLQ